MKKALTPVKLMAFAFRTYPYLNNTVVFAQLRRFQTTMKTSALSANARIDKRIMQCSSKLYNLFSKKFNLPIRDTISHNKPNQHGNKYDVYAVFVDKGCNNVTTRKFGRKNIEDGKDDNSSKNNSHASKRNNEFCRFIQLKLLFDEEIQITFGQKDSYIISFEVATIIAEQLQKIVCYAHP